MRVLITPQLNSAMTRLSMNARNQVNQLYALGSALTREQLTESPLFTKLNSTKGDIYTLRAQSVRVFCALDANGNLLFLDAKEVSPPTAFASSAHDELTLFGAHGDPKAYVATDEENTIYSFDGRPLAYLDDSNNIYGFNGRHLGWLEDGIVWDHSGRRVGFTTSTCPSFTKFEPFKGFKRFKPFKGFKQFAPFKPFKLLQNSQEDLLAFLEQGAR